MSTAVSRRVSTLFVAVLLALAAIFTLTPPQPANALGLIVGTPGTIENKYGGYTCKGYIQPGTPGVHITGFQIDTWIQYLQQERRRVWVDPIWRSGYYTYRMVNVWHQLDPKFSRFANSASPNMNRTGSKYYWEHYRHAGWALRGKQVRCVMAGKYRALVNGKYESVIASTVSPPRRF